MAPGRTGARMADVDDPHALEDDASGAPPGADIDGVSRRAFVAALTAAAGLAALPDETSATAPSPPAPCPASPKGRDKEWHELPDLFGMFNLIVMRTWLRNANLHDTECPPLAPASGPPPDFAKTFRTLDGTFNDLAYPSMGSAGRLFGRNVPLGVTRPEADLFEPNPRTISRELMTRHRFTPATTINVLAAAWIQFQVHDWFSHELHVTARHTVPMPAGDPWPHGALTFPTTMPAASGCTQAGGCPQPPVYRNQVPHWWDGSQLYGRNDTENGHVRTGRGGKIKVNPSGLLLWDAATKTEVTGFIPNGWMGVSMLHGLFALEHNAICDRLAATHAGWSDDRLHHTARLIVAALLAKIHTLEWTLAALQTNVLTAAMRTNWKGVLGALQEVARVLQDSELLGGILGSPADHHGAPYAMTEEFVAVYRMHPLMPDQFVLRSHENDAAFETLGLKDVAGIKGRAVLERHEDRFADLFYSFGVAHPGAITLQNYPGHLQEIEVDGRRIDLAAVEIVRDRERGIPRYNLFRRLVGKRPIERFCDLTPDEDLARRLERIYGDVERIDAMVGMLAETPPRGFAFSDTAFRIFILMASRRLKSDRFYTKEGYSKAIYTQEGLDWIDCNSMATVLRRHYPALRCRIAPHANAFKPWVET